MTSVAHEPSETEQMMDVLCPWYILIDETGRIWRTGAVVKKLNRGQPLTGKHLLSFVDLRRPKALSSMESLLSQTGRKLHLVTQAAPHTELKGVMARLPEGAVPGCERGAVLSLSFGISVLDAVRDYGLSANDFAATDLTVEMLYLIEAKSAVMQELRHLNTRLETARTEAEEQAVTDTLTGLGNRRAMEHSLHQLVLRKTGFAMMHIDLDYFKHVNDTYGHAAGDAVLLHVADRLRGVTRIEDTVIRQGGDEFMLVLPGVIDDENVSNLAARLVREIEQPVLFGGQQLNVSASIGISIAKDVSAVIPEVMMEEADTALYAVKERGRHGYLIYTSDLGRMDGSGTAA